MNLSVKIDPLLKIFSKHVLKRSIKGYKNRERITSKFVMKSNLRLMAKCNGTTTKVPTSSAKVCNGVQKLQSVQSPKE